MMGILFIYVSTATGLVRYIYLQGVRVPVIWKGGAFISQYL
ncbi:hypothetical protein E6C60_2291 [Paenibacillus algicola]|uniref:Uncharacterized protein n=1 Tax=Paenibacillus algicola TaxID=2565926 RepID=A0A4P8XKX7_9BACL|nr:hypothetical protein E6C60_2291 [Paenibacillus algicola]